MNNVEQIIQNILPPEDLRTSSEEQRVLILRDKIQRIKQNTMFPVLSPMQQSVIKNMIFLVDHEYTDLKGRIPSLHCLDITHVESRSNPYTHYISLDRAQLTGTSFKGECFLANCISMVTVSFWEPRKATHTILPLEVIQDSFHPEIQEDRSLEHYQNIQATGDPKSPFIVITLSSPHKDYENAPIRYEIDYHNGQTTRKTMEKEQREQSLMKVYTARNKICERIFPRSKPHFHERVMHSISSTFWQKNS